MLPGRPPRPAVTKLREGVPPSKVKFGAKAPVESLPEPDWAKLFPVMADITLAKANSRCRQIAAAEWKRVVPILDIAVGLSGLDLTLVRDYCRVVARL